MKTLVLSTLIAVATTGNTFANQGEQQVSNLGMETKEITLPAKRIDTFKSQVIFHQQNVATIWNQYDLASARIKSKAGNHAELEQEKAFFISIYKQDIEHGLRVAESKAAIAELEKRYEQKHADRQALEAKEMVQLQRFLKKELKREIKSFEKAKKSNAELVNAETLPLIREVEQYFAQSITKADELMKGSDVHTIAAQ